MRTWSIPAGRIFGVEIRVHFLFILILPFISFSERAANSNATPGRVAALAAIVLGSVLIHEIGHALAEKLSGAPRRAVVLFPIGGVTVFDEAQAEVSRERARGRARDYG